MDNIIFTYEGFGQTNIGDYIQSLAAWQYFETESVTFCNRDELNSVTNSSRAIMNGWFTHRPQNWPPSSTILPLFVAAHFNSSAYSSLLSEESINYLRQYQPIGCRDKDTMRKLQEKGVEAYFSSCLTTTLGYKYGKPKHERKGGIYVVDPVHYIPEQNYRLRKYLFLFKYLLNFRGVNRYIANLKRNNPVSIQWKTKKLYMLASSTRSYIIVKKIIGSEALKGATILTQSHIEAEIPTNEERFERARKLLDLYSEASLVLTSRIHCALPCTGLETPVIFFQNMDDSLESKCRFDGLLDLLNVVEFKNDEVISSPFELPVSPKCVKNPSLYKTFAEKLKETCMRFVGINA